MKGSAGPKQPAVVRHLLTRWRSRLKGPDVFKMVSGGHFRCCARSGRRRKEEVGA